MKKSIAVSVLPADISRFEADVIALKYARGLFGAALTVAKLLGKTEAVMQQLLPSVGSIHLFSGLGLIKAKQALFLRVVQLSSFDYIEIRQFSFDVLKGLRTLAPETRHLAMTVHGTGFGLNTAKAVHAEIYGCMEALKSQEYPPHLERISIVDRNEALVRQFQAKLSEILPGHKIEIAASPGPAWSTDETQRSQVSLSQAGYDVFISYKSEDTAYATEVYEILKSRGLKVFFSRESLPKLGSDEYHEQIDLAIEKARHMVVVTSSGEHALAKWVNYEWRLFLGEKLAGRKAGNLVTVIAGGMSIGDLPISLRHREVIQLIPPDLERLFEYLRAENT